MVISVISYRLQEMGGEGLGMEQESWNRDRFGEGLGRSLDFTQRAVEGL